MGAESAFKSAEGSRLMGKEAQWLQHYKELTQLIYTLRSLCPRLALVGASVANPRHPPPAIHLELVAAMTIDEGRKILPGSETPKRRLTIPSLLVIARKWLWCLLAAARDSVAVLNLKIRLRRTLNLMRRLPADVVMKTWRFAPDAQGARRDFYYGTLPDWLARRGVSYLLLWGDHGDGLEKAFGQGGRTQERIRSLPERVLLPVWAPLATAFEQLLTSLMLRRLAKKAREPKFGLLCARASVDCLNPSTTRNMLYFYIARSAVKIWRPKVFLSLYEGQPWEIPVRHGVKAADKSCIVAGYQHTVVMPHSLSLTWPNQNSWELSAPEVVLCLGQATKNMMQCGHEPCGTKLISFGSFRLNSPKAEMMNCQLKRQTVLVVPETGVIREAQLLFNFAMQTAALLLQYRFVFRCHPVMPFERIQPHLERAPESLPNVEISEGPIESDFARSSVVLYRGSSSILYAVLYGLKPVYLQDGHSSVDPLFELQGWRERVSRPEQMVELLRHCAPASDERAARERRSAMEYVKSYAMPVTEESVDGFLRAAGLSSARGGV